MELGWNDQVVGLVFGNMDTETGKQKLENKNSEKLEKFRWKFRFL